MKAKDFKLFAYKGPIMVEDNCVQEVWNADTMAFDKRDAYNKLVMMCRHSALDFIDRSIKISLPGRLTEVRI